MEPETRNVGSPRVKRPMTALERAEKACTHPPAQGIFASRDTLTLIKLNHLLLFKGQFEVCPRGSGCDTSRHARDNQAEPGGNTLLSKQKLASCEVLKGLAELADRYHIIRLGDKRRN